MKFAQDTDRAIESLKSKFKDVMDYTSADLFESVVSKTPVKTGSAISSWEFENEAVDVFHVSYFNEDENTPIAWSLARAQELSITFWNVVQPLIASGDFLQTCSIKNEIYYVNLLENGGYTGDEYIQEMPPYYTDRPVPFTLTSGGMSHKSPLGMVKTTLPEVEEKVSKNAGIFNT